MHKFIVRNISGSFERVIEADNCVQACLRAFAQGAHHKCKLRATMIHGRKPLPAYRRINLGRVVAGGMNMTDQELASLALDAACKVIQDHLGVTDGGLAGRFFSDDEVLDSLVEYIAAEREAATEWASAARPLMALCRP